MAASRRPVLAWVTHYEYTDPTTNKTDESYQVSFQPYKAQVTQVRLIARGGHGGAQRGARAAQLVRRSPGASRARLGVWLRGAGCGRGAAGQ